MKSLKEFVTERRNKPSDENPDEVYCIIDSLILFEDDPTVGRFASSLNEGSIYQRIPGTRHYYRKDKGQPIKGKEWHIHVFKDSRHNNQLFAINADGSTHDGSSIWINKEMCSFLNSIGIQVPPNGFLLEMYTGNTTQLLYD